MSLIHAWSSCLFYLGSQFSLNYFIEVHLHFSFYFIHFYSCLMLSYLQIRVLQIFQTLEWNLSEVLKLKLLFSTKEYFIIHHRNYLHFYLMLSFSFYRQVFFILNLFGQGHHFIIFTRSLELFFLFLKLFTCLFKIQDLFIFLCYLILAIFQLLLFSFCIILLIVLFFSFHSQSLINPKLFF